MLFYSILLHVVFNVTFKCPSLGPITYMQYIILQNTPGQFLDCPWGGSVESPAETMAEYETISSS